MLRLRSCASSMISVSYVASSGSPCVSASRMPSVISLTSVPGFVWSLKRTLYPTTVPSSVDSSCAIRAATARAAIRRGCVWPINPRSPHPTAMQILGSCVVLPDPVSPHTITT